MAGTDAEDVERLGGSTTGGRELDDESLEHQVSRPSASLGPSQTGSVKTEPYPWGRKRR